MRTETNKGEGINPFTDLLLTENDVKQKCDVTDVDLEVARTDKMKKVK